VTQAWSPIGGVKRYMGEAHASGDPLSHAVVREIAARYGKTPAQVVLRWQIDLGHSVIPKSVNPSRIAENADIFDFALSPDEIVAIDALGRAFTGNQSIQSLRKRGRHVQVGLTSQEERGQVAIPIDILITGSGRWWGRRAIRTPTTTSFWRSSRAGSSTRRGLSRARSRSKT
jgi:Aldo/keto reductase family